MAVDIYIEGQRLDTFDKEESINVTTAVQDVKDISKIRGDFSQSFTVPSSPNNDEIFAHYYNADIDNGFDARTRKLATIDIDTLDFKRGKIQLVDVAIKENQISHYKVVFFGDTIKIKDLIGDDKIKDLTWLDNFNHDYTAANVKIGLTTGLDFTVDSVTYNKAVCYPLISYARQYLYNSDATDTTSTDALVNIAYDAGRTDGISFGELRPAIQVKLIIQAITEKYGITFSGSFFDTTKFTELYVNVNNTKDDLNNGLLLYEDVSGTQATISNIADRYRYQTTITPKAGFENIDYKIRLTCLNQVVYESNTWITGTNTKIGGLIQFQEDYTAKAEVITETDFEFDATTKLEYFYQDGFATTFLEVFSNSYTNQVIDLDTVITTSFKDIKVYDFLTSIFKMFNLVVVPDGEDLYVQDLQSWYIEGQIYDITPYIDTTEYKISRGKILNQINFKYKESKQILADFYNQENGIYYGNLEQKLYDTDGELLSGDTLDIEVIFEQPIFERLNDIDDNSEIDLIYGLMLNDSSSKFVGEPFLMYLPSVNVSSNPLGFDGDSYEQLSANVLMPSHSQEYDTASFNINFGAEINEFTSQVFEDSIYQNLFSDYIGDIFSIKRRIYNYTGILPNWLITILKPNDRLIINDRRYLINTITSNITKRKDKLELINDIYDAPLASDSLNSSLWNPTTDAYSGNAVSGDSNYIGDASAILSLVDTGFGTSWVTITGSVTGVINTITFDLDANNTGAIRTAQIKATDGVNDPKYTIVQNDAIIKADNNIVTVDNDIITVDNG